jgi:hypothetical protein
MFRMQTVRQSPPVPVVCCDYCRQRIERGEDGLITWQSNADALPTDGTIFALHKRCNRDFVADHRGLDFSHWEELTLVPLILSLTLEIKYKEAIEQFRALNGYLED